MATDEPVEQHPSNGSAAAGGGTPELAVMLTTDSLGTIRKVLAYLRAQSVAHRLQVVVAAPPGSDVTASAPELSGFADVRVVEVEGDSIRDAHVATLMAATAPVVAIGETHAYPEPEYAERMIEAHRGPWAAVGPAMDNANPGTILSWVELFMSYGPWFEPSRGVTDDVPGHNSTYKRGILLDLGDRLDELIEHSTVLHHELRARGYELYVEPGARVYHLNPSMWGSYVVQAFQGGRLFAQVRAAQWSWPRRLAFGAGSVLIPLVRLRRILRDVRRTPRGRELFPRIVLGLLPVLFVSGLGEAAGYLAGAGSTRVLHEAELHRGRFLRPADRLRDEDESTWPASGGAQPIAERPGS